MSKLITCDSVFEILTRGPFPTGETDSDAAVELHLTGCHECRQLAEALRPAVDLFGESLEDESLPAYRGSAGRSVPSWYALEFVEPGVADGAVTTTAPAGVTTQATQTTTASGPAMPMTRTDWKSEVTAQLARIVAACLLIGLLIGGVFAIGALRTPTAGDMRGRLLQWDLPSTCVVALLQPGESFEEPISRRDPASLAAGCCTNCHRAESVSGARSNTEQSEARVRQTTALIAKSCRVCHR